MEHLFLSKRADWRLNFPQVDGMNFLNTARCVLRFHPPPFSNDMQFLRQSVKKMDLACRNRFRDVHYRYSVRCVASSSMNLKLADIPRTEKVELACPVCYQPLIPSGSQDFYVLKVESSSFLCKNCQKTFASDVGIIDLTIPSDGVVAFGSSFFQLPLVAYVYERGYRDIFGVFSFPGIEKEAIMAQKLLEPARGEVIMDLSCGPGAFTRHFLASGQYKTVVASDFSQAMLEQCRGFLKGDASTDLSKVVLVKADAARLPFVTASFAGVHAAAAIHCWPNVLASVAEISRVLRPGGVFVASTFILPTPRGLEEPLKPIRQTLEQLQLSFAWFTEAELRATLEACGFVNWCSYRRGFYILFSASKPVS